MNQTTLNAETSGMQMQRYPQADTQQHVQCQLGVSCSQAVTTSLQHLRTNNRTACFLTAARMRNTLDCMFCVFLSTGFDVSHLLVSVCMHMSAHKREASPALNAQTDFNRMRKCSLTQAVLHQAMQNSWLIAAKQHEPETLNARSSGMQMQRYPQADSHQHVQCQLDFSCQAITTSLQHLRKNNRTTCSLTAAGTRNILSCMLSVFQKLF